MKKQILFLASLMTVSLILFTSCKDDEPIDTNAGKPKVENLTLTPDGNLKYGDVVNISATFSDETGLRTYTIQISNASGLIYEKTEMLTGKTFALNLDVPIPLPKNAVAGDMTINITVKNSGNQITSTDKVINNLALPTFESLYLFVNSVAYPLSKNGNVFEVEDFFPASATAKIYANADKTGLYWGLDGTEIKALGSDEIVIGKETEEFFKISFNPISFELTLGAAQQWNTTSESLYILGTISGHWADGKISEEKAKMKMNGFTLGSRKMWSWTAPNSGTGSADDDMWGNIVAGQFRFKKAGVSEYITYNGTQIVSGADNEANSFVTTAGGADYVIKVLSDGTNITSVSLEDGTKKLEYTNNGIFINGIKATSSMSFAGNSLSLVTGNYFLYEGSMDLTKNQSITGVGVNLATAFCDPDVFSGKGNTTWTFTQITNRYYVRIDAFSGHIYVRSEAGYPDAIYFDGWSMAKHADDPNNTWGAERRICLYRVGTTNTYEAIFYLFPWGGDASFFAAPPTVSDYAEREIFAKYFDGVEFAGTNFKLPQSADAAYYKVKVDVKDGFTFDTNQKDGTTNNYLLVPTNNKKFTVTFTAQ